MKLLTIPLAALSTTSLIHLLVFIVIGALIIWCIYYLIGRIGVPEPFRTITYIVIALVILVYLLNYFGFW